MRVCGGGGGPGNSQFAICFFRNTGTAPLEKQLDLLYRRYRRLKFCSQRRMRRSYEKRFATVYIEY